LLLLKTHNTYILYYDERKTLDNSRVIHINPLDPDSVERVGVLLRKYILFGYLNNLGKEHKYKQLLKEYIKYIPVEFLEFNISSYYYKFHSYPKTKLSFEEIIRQIENDPIYKSKGRPDRENILDCVKELLNDVESNAACLRDDYLLCYNCGTKILSYNTEKLNYLKCTAHDCKCLVDSTNQENVTLKIDDDRYSNLNKKEFGMDYFTLSMTKI